MKYIQKVFLAANVKGSFQTQEYIHSVLNKRCHVKSGCSLMHTLCTFLCQICRTVSPFNQKQYSQHLWLLTYCFTASDSFTVQNSSPTNSFTVYWCIIISWSYSHLITTVETPETFGKCSHSYVPLKYIYVWNIFIWLSKGFVKSPVTLWWHVVKYDKSIKDNVSSFCSYCTVFTFSSLDTLTPHCCLNVTVCVLFSGCEKHVVYIYIYSRTMSLFYYFTELDNVTILCVSAY